MSSTIWFNYSVSSSVCGWKVVLELKWVPGAFLRPRLKADIKVSTQRFLKAASESRYKAWSQSDTIDTGTLRSLTISLMYNCVHVSTVYMALPSRKCVNLVSLLTITHITIYMVFSLYENSHLYYFLIFTFSLSIFSHPYFSICSHN